MIARQTKIGLVTLLGLILLVSFQNCTRTSFSQSESASSTAIKSEDNGGPYGGKPTDYRFSDAYQPCTRLDLKGKPLPNEVIITKFKTGGELAPFQARTSCQDISPKELPAADVVYDPGTASLLYQGKEFSSKRPSEFDVFKADCPVGMTPLAGAVRTNLFAFALDWTQLQSQQGQMWNLGWYHFPGISAGLEATIAGLPAFLIRRSDAAYLDYWRRSSQHIYLRANTAYSFTFAMQSHSLSAMDFTFYKSTTGQLVNPLNDEINVRFDGQTGVSQILRAVNLSNVTARMTPFANGYIGTVFFTTSSNGDGVTNIGLAPSAGGAGLGQLGDSILATGPQLVEVQQYCK